MPNSFFLDGSGVLRIESLVDINRGFQNRRLNSVNGFKVTGILEQVLGALSGIPAESGSSDSPPSVYYRF